MAELFVLKPNGFAGSPIQKSGQPFVFKERLALSIEIRHYKSQSLNRKTQNPFSLRAGQCRAEQD